MVPFAALRVTLLLSRLMLGHARNRKARGRRPRGLHLQSEQGALPRAEAHQARPGALLPRGGRGRAARRRRPAQRAGALPQRDRAASSSTRSARRPRVRPGSRWSRSSSPRDGARRKWCRATRRRWPGSPTSPASSCTRIRSAPTTSTIPTSCGWISTRCRASSGTRCGRWRGWSRRRSASSGSPAGPRPRARAGFTSIVRIERRWSFDRGPARGAGARARSGAARAGARHQQVVEGRAPRRVRGLQPERQGPHRRVGLLGAAQAGRAGVRADRLGRAGRLRSRATFTLATMPARFAGARRSAMPASTITPARSTRCWSCRRGTSARGWATRRGLRTTRSSRASRRGCSRPRARAAKHPLIEIGRAQRKEDALAGLERWKARHPEAAAHLEPADVLVDAMRGRFSTWTRIRVNLQHVPAELRPAQEPLDPDEKTLASS